MQLERTDVNNTICPSAIPRVRVSLFSSYSTLLAQLAEGFRQHGDVLQLTGIPIRVFAFRHPDHIKQIYTHKTIGTTKDPSMLPRVQWIMGRGSFINPGGEDWKRRRNLLQFGLTRAASMELARAVPFAMHKALERLQVFAAKGEAVDIHREMGRLIVDVTLKSLFSEDAGAKLESIYEQTQFLLESFTSRIPVQLPSLGNYRFRLVAYKLQRFMRELIEKRLCSHDRPTDLLTLLTTPDKQTGQIRSIQDVQDEMFSLFFGASIMKIALAWACYLLSLHPHVFSQLQIEVQALLNGRMPTPEDLERLPYTEMVFQETTRLYPPVWGYPRYASKKVQIGGHTFPARSLLLPIGYFAHRHPIFWNDPEVFDPERFAPDKVGTIHPFAHYPFGGGPRMCLGRNLAPIICKLILVMLVQRFAFTFTPRTPGEPILDFDFELGARGGIWMTLREKSATP
jgi:cytochrome P450